MGRGITALSPAGTPRHGHGSSALPSHRENQREKLPARREARPGCGAPTRRNPAAPVPAPQLPHFHPLNLDGARCRPESRQLLAHTVAGIYRVKSNEFWEMFLGAFKSSLHIIEFNWAAADERVGGESGEGRAPAARFRPSPEARGAMSQTERPCDSPGIAHPMAGSLRASGTPSDGWHCSRGLVVGTLYNAALQRRAGSLGKLAVRGHLLVLGSLKGASICAVPGTPTREAQR